MGRPKGSKNKPKENARELFDAVNVKSKVNKPVAKPLQSEEAAKVYIKAAVDLAMTGARNYIVDKVTAWKAARMGELRCDTSADGEYDTYRLIDDNGDEVDSVTIQHVDVEYVVRQILGLE